MYMKKGPILQATRKKVKVSLNTKNEPMDQKCVNWKRKWGISFDVGVNRYRNSNKLIITHSW